MHGPSMDGEGTFNYVEYPVRFGKIPNLKPAPSYIHDTLPAVLTDGYDYLPPNTCVKWIPTTFELLDFLLFKGYKYGS